MKTPFWMWNRVLTGLSGKEFGSSRWAAGLMVWGILFALPGCVTQKTEWFKNDPQSYVAMERGQVQRMRVAIAAHSWMYRGPLYNPLGGDSKELPILTEVVPDNIGQADRLFRNTASWRILQGDHLTSVNMLHHGNVGIVALCFDTICVTIKPPHVI